MILAPFVTSGKKYTDGNKTLLPVTIHVNHLVADGYHLGVFFNELQELSDTCEEWIGTKPSNTD